MSSFFAGSSAAGGVGGGPPSAPSTTAAVIAGASPSPFRLYEVLEEEEEEEGREGLEASVECSEAAAGGAGSSLEAEAAGGHRSPIARKRARRRSSSDISNVSLGGFGAGVGGTTASATAGSRPMMASAGSGGGSWHEANGGQTSRSLTVGGGWGVPEHHDLQAFVQW